VLSTCPAIELRDARKSVEHAHRALALSPKNADYWATLGTAQYVAGDYAAAIASLEDAQNHFGGRLPSDAKLVLAMAHYQLGDGDLGREIYQEVIDELNNKKTYSEWYKMEFRSLRAEADRLFAAPPQ
jgi:tetratricopeptide (TPR) repeat protein